MQNNQEFEAYKLSAKLALLTMIRQCQEEVTNLERFEDNRMLVATGDIHRCMEYVQNTADELENAFNEVQQ